MLDKYKHISFDLDGTILSTKMEYIEGITRKIVDKLGGEIEDPRSIKKLWFENDRSKIIKDNFDVDPEDFWKLFRKWETPRKRYKYTSTFNDVEPSLKKLKEMGKIVSIVTGCHFSTRKLKIDFDRKLCDMIFAIQYNKFAPKPDPKSFFHVLDKVNSKPEETLYIGNSIEDALYCQNAKVDFIHIERNEYPSDLKDYAKKVIYSFDELFI